MHHNIRMTDHFVFRNHLCIACECLSINLYEFIKGNNYRGFSLSLIKRFAVQILQSLCLLYEHGVIHCDLKPEVTSWFLYGTKFLLLTMYRISYWNIRPRVRSRLLTLAAAALKMIEVKEETGWLYSLCFLISVYIVYTYIQSRFYRSPEVILGKVSTLCQT